jgi:hypothetical protein
VTARVRRDALGLRGGRRDRRLMRQGSEASPTGRVGDVGWSSSASGEWGYGGPACR